jgi:hypothetical protein
MLSPKLLNVLHAPGIGDGLTTAPAFRTVLSPVLAWFRVALAGGSSTESRSGRARRCGSSTATRKMTIDDAA